MEEKSKTIHSTPTIMADDVDGILILKTLTFKSGTSVRKSYPFFMIFWHFLVSFSLSRAVFCLVKPPKDLSDWKVVFCKWTVIFLWHHVFMAEHNM